MTLMKTGIHPDNYRLVAFKDMSNDDISTVCMNVVPIPDTPILLVLLPLPVICAHLSVPN